MHLELLKIVGTAVIRRINFPKTKAGKMNRHSSLTARVRPLLSEHDEAEVRQTCALVMMRAGLPETTLAQCGRADHFAAICPLYRFAPGYKSQVAQGMRHLPLSTWRALFHESRVVLRIGRKAETHELPTAPENMPEVPCYGPRDSSDESERRDILARRARYLHACLWASRYADPSRKARAAFVGHLRYLRTAVRALAGFGHGAPDAWQDDSARRQAKRRFLEYIARGEEILTAEATAEIPAGPQERTFREFSEIPAGFALA